MSKDTPLIACTGLQDASELVKQAYPEATPDYLGTKIKTRKTNYNEVLDYHGLSCFPAGEQVEYLKKLRRLLVDGGIITIFAPSLEWGMEQVGSENPSPITMIHLYGEKGERKNTCMLRTLRRDLELAGFHVTHATPGYYALEVEISGKAGTLEAGHHIVVAKKVENETD